MRTMTAKDLKNHTGEAMRTVSKGEKVVVTLRGRPFALISPVTSALLEKVSMRLPEEAWKDIETTLRKTKPKFKNFREAMNWTRKR
ncbi:MAG: type II toxin-antitoxin system prevent-host-death family antitoxin [Syntrophaceae bacterium]|jgi:prevent-host-death family protein|nr:type II toxin-antitoxin system prevent-host-death family antitoxin [Syntrophaceae bacterium]